MLKILKFSHHFALESPQEVYRRAIDDFARTYLLQITFYKLYNHKVVQRTDKMFAVRSKNPLVYRFHINILDKFLDYMRSRGFNNFDIKEEPMYEPAKAEFKLITDKRPWGMQPEIIEYLISPGKKKVVELQTGGGKGLINGTPVRTLHGWTNIEDLKVGDKVMGETGEFHSVTGVYPQGVKDLYRFTFRDGRQIVTDESHLWSVKYCPKGTGWCTTKGVLSTKELLEYQANLKTGLSRFYIPLIENKVFEPNIDLPIDPYLLGVILGDGSIKSNYIRIEKPVKELHELLASILDSMGVTYSFKSFIKKCKLFSGGTRDKLVMQTSISKSVSPANKEFFEKLEKLGLLELRTVDKFIPSEYLTAGTEQRLELVRGLMDTDGYPTEHGGVEIGFISERLADQTRELLFSLGCMVTKRMKRPTYTHHEVKKTGRDYYRMHVRSRSIIELFKTEERRSRAQSKTQYTDGLHLRIESIEKLPEQGHTTCISVDNPTKLFVTKDYLITHNTLCTLFAVYGIGERTLLSIKPMYIQRWLDDVTKDTGIFKLKKDEIVVIKGSQALASVIKMALDNKLTYKFIIISNKTLYNYYKDFTEGVNMEKYFNVKPFDLFKVLKVGVRIIDEAHQDFHQCFKTDLFSHIPKTIELSATLTPDSPFLKNMYEIMYPLEDRLGGGVYNKYINVFSVPYRLDKTNNQSVRVNQRGMLSYSHGSLEESIMKDKKRLENYLDMILDLTENYFIQKRHADFKLLIFAGRVELCKIIVEKLQTLYPKLKISKYTEEDDYSVLADVDIIVSTPISSGTAVDIPRLQVCINTVAIGSTQANLQMIGRLRELRGVDIKPTFLYLYCVDIAKHVEYHVKKRNHTFKDRVLSYTDLVPIKYTV